jgi:hypothetical protein
MALGQSNDLQPGRLELIACDSDKNRCELIDVYEATSGLPGRQAPSDRNVRAKGPIPDQGFTRDRQPLFISTKLIDLRGVKGIEGNFYPITPTTIRTPVRTRSQFGLHADKNVPGTAGCIGVTDDEDWAKLQLKLKEIGASGVDKIPLVVSYQTVINPRI